ncbi:ABC transporter type 1, transmembrane domain-containing protein [Melanogaster broomeanus]|nr:ABC transporter type 1, transmembrane domain-containing protein [Melanogaster broomeanus]
MTLNKDDVWNLSPNTQSRPVFTKFSMTRFLYANTPLMYTPDGLAEAPHSSVVSSGPTPWILCSVDFLLTIVSVVFNYASPYLLGRILESFEDPTPEKRSQAYIYAFLAFLCTLLKAEADVQHLWLGRRAATRIRVELMAAIYDKALKRQDYSGVVDKDKVKEAADKKAGISPSQNPTADDPKAGADVGKIVNLMAVDANRIAMLVSGMYFIYGGPLEIIIASTFLYNLIGLSAFAGFIVIVIGWPLNSFITRRSIRIQKGVSVSRDKRMAVLNELISAVKFIKFFAWEERWVKRTMEARGVEMGWMVKARINSVMFTAVWTSAPILISLISFFTYVYQGNQLTVSVAFTSIALFSMIRQPLNIIPSWIVQVLQTGVALDRIETYLNEEEVTEQVSSIKRSRLPTDSLVDDDGLAIESGTFKWNEVPEKEDTTKNGTATGKGDGKNGSSNTQDANDDTETAIDTESMTGASVVEDHKFELRDISVRFPEGELTLITGPTASGKTAMLMALLGEMTITSGKLIMSKNTSKVDEYGHMHALSYAAQSPWLRHQSIKDNILFGYPYDEERYNAVVECCALRPDLSILEDGDETEIGARWTEGPLITALIPLIVSRPTGQSHCAVLVRETPVRTSARPPYGDSLELVLPGAHFLVRMLDGRIDTQGTVKELRAQGILEHVAQDAEADVKQEEPVASSDAPAIEGDVEAENAETSTTTGDPAKEPRKLVTDEHRRSGDVKSYWTWVILTLFILCSQSLGVIEKVWVMHQSSAYYHVQSRSWGWFNLPDANEHPLFYVSIYGAIGMATALVSVASTTVQYTGALKASRTVFRRLLEGVVRATMRWHDVTPQGRMLNRFGKDIETIDNNLAGSLSAVNSSLATFAAAIITVAFIFPLFLIPAAIIGYFYRLLALGYLRTGRDLRRMESNSRSPIFSGFGELLEGIVTVRAFSVERRFMDDLHGKIDITTKMWYNFWMTNRWLLLNFDALGGLAVLITKLFALSGYVGPGIAGLCITSAMTFTMSVYWACRLWTALELDLNSVERVTEYLDLPPEPPAVIESNRPPAYWPSSSSNNALIAVEDLLIKYAPELPAVLHHISFDLQARERVGLLGRMGSGKSTLAMSILRFLDPVEGRIMIDGIDISTIGIHDLRSRLDATLFSGTLRDNLDPFSKAEDHPGWLASANYRYDRRTRRQRMPRCTLPRPNADVEGIASSIASTAATEVDPKTTITLGTQRPLIAMARALLWRSAIIVLDEATSSIDFDTDAKIQATIREQFDNSLLLTVVHRLRTVIDYDHLLVLDKEEIAEFDMPLDLIQNGVFRNMCLKSGTFAEVEAVTGAKAEGLGGKAGGRMMG